MNTSSVDVRVLAGIWFVYVAVVLVNTVAVLVGRGEPGGIAYTVLWVTGRGRLVLALLVVFAALLVVFSERPSGAVALFAILAVGTALFEAVWWVPVDRIGLSNLFQILAVRQIAIVLTTLVALGVLVVGRRRLGTPA